MKQIKWNQQDQPTKNSDFKLQQEEIYKAIEDQFKGTPAFVFSGCNVSGLNVSAGLCYIEGKVVELEAATVEAFPRYIKLTTIDYDPRLHPQSSSNLDTKTNYKAEIVDSTSGLTDYITISSTGCNRRIQNYFTNENNLPVDWSYVEAHKDFGTGNQTITVGTPAPITFTSETDDLAEYTAGTGIFVAQKAGIYTASFGGRVDLAGDGFALEIQHWNGSAWVVIANSLRNTVSMQGNVTTSTQKKLSAGGQLRFMVSAFGSNASLQEGHLSISRIR